MTLRLSAAVSPFGVVTTVLGVAMSFVSAPLHAQAFEGAVTMRVSAGAASPAREVEYVMRGGKVRINMNAAGRSASMIAVPAEKKMYMLMDAQSMYIEMSTDPAANPSVRAAMDSVSKKINAAPAPKITRTGKKERIAGYECEHVLVETQTDSFDMCNTKALGSFVNAMSGMGGMGGRGGAATPAWQTSLTDVGAFPLKVARKDGGVVLEVIKVEKRAIPEAQFTIPSNYTKMSMPSRPPGR